MNLLNPLLNPTLCSRTFFATIPYHSLGTQAAEQKASSTKVQNQVICKGWLAMHNYSFIKGGSKDFWLVLGCT